MLHQASASAVGVAEKQLAVEQSLMAVTSAEVLVDLGAAERKGASLVELAVCHPRIFDWVYLKGIMDFARPTFFRLLCHVAHPAIHKSK